MLRIAVAVGAGWGRLQRRRRPRVGVSASAKASLAPTPKVAAGGRPSVRPSATSASGWRAALAARAPLIGPLVCSSAGAGARPLAAPTNGARAAPPGTRSPSEFQLALQSGRNFRGPFPSPSLSPSLSLSLLSVQAQSSHAPAHWRALVALCACSASLGRLSRAHSELASRR